MTNDYDDDVDQINFMEAVMFNLFVIFQERRDHGASVSPSVASV